MGRVPCTPVAEQGHKTHPATTPPIPSSSGFSKESGGPSEIKNRGGSRACPLCVHTCMRVCVHACVWRVVGLLAKYCLSAPWSQEMKEGRPLKSTKHPPCILTWHPENDARVQAQPGSDLAPPLHSLVRQSRSVTGNRDSSVAAEGASAVKEKEPHPAPPSIMVPGGR